MIYKLLRRHPPRKIFPPLLPEARRHRPRWPKAPCRPFSSAPIASTPSAGKKQLVVLFQRGRRRRSQYRRPLRRTQLLPACVPSIAIPPAEGAAATMRRSISTVFFFFRPPSPPPRFFSRPLFPEKSASPSCKPPARPDPTRLALRCAGLHGIRHTRCEVHTGWMARPRPSARFPKKDASPFRAVAMGPNLPAHVARQHRRHFAIPDLRQFKSSATIRGDGQRWREGGFEGHVCPNGRSTRCTATGTETF